MRWIIFATFVLSSVFGSQPSDSSVVEKSPSKAVLCSIIPGGGQIYNEKYGKAVLILTVEAYVAYEFYLNRTNYHNWREGKYPLPRYRYRDKRNKYAWWVGFVYIYNLLDALVDSHLSAFEEDEFKDEDAQVEVEPEPKEE